jgi:pyridinium-3,5-biscarboxylic acid mononucleotide sulfurtransferase
MEQKLDEKLRLLQQRLRDLGSVLIAYSGGMDSAFLAAAAARTLGDNALAVTAASETYPQWERDEAVAFAKQFGIRHQILETSELGIPGFRENPPRRCYYCKSELCQKLVALAKELGLAAVLDGTNADDQSDYRPGREAAREHGILSPLLEFELTKNDIRALSRAWGLPTAEKPSFACLASRIPFGEEITALKLRQVAEAEELLRRLGLRQFRVRHHGEVARLEVEPGDEALVLLEHRAAITTHLHALGFRYVTLDLEGYRTGSLNPL